MKTGVLKLYDLRVSKQRVISASSPYEIACGMGKLSFRQASLLEVLPKTGSRFKLHKAAVNVTDLAALTAHTGNEFAMFTRGSQRLVVRGNNKVVDLSPKELKTLKEIGFRWSAHTHPVPNTIHSNIYINASDGDRLALRILEQERSLILDDFGRRNVFDQINNLTIKEMKILSNSSNSTSRKLVP